MKSPERTEAEPEVALVEVRIEEPAGPYHTYTYDSRRHALRLNETVLDVPVAPAEIGTLTRTERRAAPGITALVLTGVPTFPGCLVEARILGGVSLGGDEETHPLVIAVPPSRTRYSGAETLADLSEVDLAELRAFITRRFGSEPGRWLPVAAVQRQVRSAIELAVQERALHAQVRYGAAWLAKAPPREDGREAEPHTWAEHLLPTLPLRFQKYLAELLYPDERILFFAERPPFKHGRRLLGATQEWEGLLLISDRSLIFMTDTLPPGATMVHWGYIAKITAVERIVAARVEDRPRSVDLALEVEASGGSETIVLPFPPAYRPALTEGAKLLHAFGPAEGTWAVRRLYLARDPRRGQADPEAVCDLKASVLTEKSGMQEVHITPPRLMIRSGADCWTGKVDEVSSIEVIQSLIGCRLSVIVPAGGGQRKITLRYAYTQSPPFLDAVAVVRHLLGQPLCCRKLSDC